MLDKHDSRRQRGTRPNGVEFQISEPGMSQGTAKNGGAEARGGQRGRNRPRVAPGIKIERFFTTSGDDGFRGVEWELRTASNVGEGGKVVFEPRDVEVPKTW